MTFGIHLNVALREAARLVVLVERVVATVENIQFRISKSGVLSFVGTSVMPPYVLGPKIQLVNGFIAL
jgi:hypothetical protein